MPEPATVPATPSRKLAILVSGRGSNMEAIVRAIQSQNWPVTVAAVIAHRDDIPAVASARALGLPVRIVPLTRGLDRAEQDAQLSGCLHELAPDWIVLAGYMRILSEGFVARHAGRMVNIHPSLLPAFSGLDTHRRALAAGVKVHGATVHLVTAELDAGPIIAQAVVPVRPDDSEAALAERVLQAEHRLYPLALRALIEGQIALDGCRALWRGGPPGALAVDPLLLMPETA
ncbi:MAG TPA: phosphoribosylglycinamide formyltransferase, partial [Burkholderiaceae bacterium]|nr:phosphoribosylglycinamide formyltransferase [Burkholderiaceae bacterium]